MIDELDFFNQATLRICSSLDINEVARECLDYLGQYIPIDGVTMSYYDEKKRTIVMLAIASRIPVHTGVKIIPVTEEGHREFKKNSATVMIHNNPEDFPVPFLVWKALGRMDKSSIVLFTWSKGRRLGQVGFFVRGRNRYTEEHARLIDLLHRPFSIAMANALQYREIVDIKELFSEDIRNLRDELKQTSSTEIIGADGGLRSVMEVVSQVAPLTTQVLLLGETGAGKEIIANRVHSLSARRDGPFVKINCGAIPEGLVDSELFGHEKGAFTGAVAQKPGRFERAHRGTIFLDEVGDLPASAQVRLLRVLQEKEIERVGGAKPIKVDVRVIAATHGNLESLVKDGVFREDLWFRLNVFPLVIPPLRERKSDIPLLVHYFITNKSRELSLKVNPVPAPGVMERLIAYDWPGNVRELQNTVERALIRARITDPTRPLAFDDFPPSPAAEPARDAGASEASFPTLNEAMRAHMEKAMERSRGRIQGKGGAAELLGLPAGTLRHRMSMLGMQYGKRRAKKGEGDDGRGNA